MQEGSFEWYKNLFKKIRGDLGNPTNQNDCLQLLINMKNDFDFSKTKNKSIKDYALQISQYSKKMAGAMAYRTGSGTFDEYYWKYMLYEAPELFESYIYYMEKNRAVDKQFYVPRENTLNVVVQDLQDLEDRLIKFYGLSLPARVGKSSICIFFLSWIMGKRPNSHNAMSGHSGILADGFYDETINLILTPEYTFGEIFPDATLYKKSAEKKEITLGAPDRFATLTCRGIDGTFTGSVDISSDGYLYVDDLVRDRTESLSPTRLENRYQDYLNVLVDRKNDGARELMVGTRWNVFDPLGRIEKQFKHDQQYRFRKIPALNENDESNFQYKYGKGFSSQYYIDIRNKLDKNEWMAKYQQTPFIREGLLFEEDSLKYFNGHIPDGIYVAKAIVDPAFGGGDSVSMPICIDHSNGKKYIIDWIFDNGTVKNTVPKVAHAIIKYNITELKVEKNNGGALYCDKINDYLKEMNYNHCRCYSVSAPNQIPKEEKIKAYSDYIKDNFLFIVKNLIIDESSECMNVYSRSKEYNNAMEELTMHSANGKNEHDDAADGLTQLAMIFENIINREPEIIQSPM